MLMSQEKRTRRDYLVELYISVALAALTLLVYSPTFHYPFVYYDDPEYVVESPHVQAGLTAESARWAFTTFDCGNWHPLTWLSLQLDSQVYGGLTAGGFHLTNVLLHTANAVLLFLALARLTGAVWRSAVVAGLFALHPLHVESVAWVAERKDVLSTLFWALTLIAYAHYARRPSAGRYLLVVLALALGLLAKPMLVTLPFVLLLLDYWPLRRWQSAASLRRPLVEKVPLFGLVLASCAVTLLAQLHGNAVASVGAFPLAARVGNALLAYVGYLGKMFWPVNLAVYYPHPGPAVPVLPALGAGLFLSALTALVLGPGRRWPYLAVGWLWYLGTLVPVIGLVQVGGQALADRYTYLGTLVPVIGLVQVGGQALADRYTYVPLIGLFLLLVWGVTDLAQGWRLPRQCLAATAAVVLSACAALTWAQVGHWDSTLHLWEHAAKVTENNYLAHINLGTCYREQGRPTAARREFEKAAAIDPKVAVAHFNLGGVLADLGRLEEALAELRMAIALGPELSVPHNTVGALLQSLGRLEEAEVEYRRAIDRGPQDAYAHHNLGMVLTEMGRREEGLAELRQAIELSPRNARLHDGLGRALQEEGRLEEALAEYRKALELGETEAGPRLQACERLRTLHSRLPGLIAGRDRPADNAERLAFAELCRQPCERCYALAARLYADAFSAGPKLADDLRAGYRFQAAGAAAAAGCGQGKDGAQLGEAEKARLRDQSLNWLQADLAVWTRQARGGTAEARAAVQRVLRAWKRDAHLVGVRDPAALAQLTPAEREAWQKLWQEVDAVLAQVSAPAKKP
jgi:tetratricopeptide (TPR) repeat protein